MTRTDFDCRDCDHRDTPRCYDTCEAYAAMKAKNAAKKAYMHDAGTRLFDYEHSHTDLAKRKRKRK